MQSYSIGLSGLVAAQKSIAVVGNNIANAATDGYHRQQVELRPVHSPETDRIGVGGGVEVAMVRRMVNELLDREILYQKSALEKTTQELDTLRTTETTFGELTGAGSLSAVMDEFFNSLQDLSAHPAEKTWQEKTIATAKTLAAKFQSLGKFLSRLKQRTALEATATINKLNALSVQIAELNRNIQRTSISGGQTNNLQDQRDHLISELSGVVDIEVRQRKYGMIDVDIDGLPVIVGSRSIELRAGLKDKDTLGISPLDAVDYRTSAGGGTIGGLLAMNNEIIPGINDKLNLLARSLIRDVNRYHVQGVGSDGSFGQLTSRKVTDENLSSLSPEVVDGEMYIRLINSTTGQYTRHKIDVDVSSDTFSTIAQKISAVSGLDASVISGKLRIQADSGYKFDFSPAVLAEPATSSFASTSAPSVSVSGIYTGEENQTITCTVSGTGAVGNGQLSLEVKNQAGEVVTRVDFGSGYAAGDKVEILDGIKISLTTGQLTDGDSFTIDVLEDTDTSGLLSSIGLNSFFSGTSAEDIQVCSEVANSSGRIATSLGAELKDNVNMVRLARLKDHPIDDLGALTPGQFYQHLTTDIGQKVSLKQMQQDNLSALVKNLVEKQNDISGVNINDEAAQMLVYEQMFQAMAKYLNVVRSSVSTIMDLL